MENRGNIRDLEHLDKRRFAGAAVQQTIDGTERRLNLTTLATSIGYPMKVELDARDSAALIRQGDSTVTLDGTTDKRITKDDQEEFTVIDANSAYFAVKQAALDTGTLVGTRIDDTGGA